jgi:hypothetical protein
MVCHSVLDLSTRSPLWFGWPVGGEDCSLEYHVELRRRPGMYRAKTGWVWFGLRILKFSFEFCVSAYRGTCLAIVSHISRWFKVEIGGGEEAICFPYLGLFCLFVCLLI